MGFLYLKIIVSFFIFAFFIRLFFAYNSRNLNLKGYDIVGTPGNNYILKCKVQTSNLLGFDKYGEMVDFYIDDNFIGMSSTDKNGIAEIGHYFDEPGTHVITIKLSEKSRYFANPSNIVAGIYNEHKPILICDIDHTVCDTKILLFLLNQDIKIPAVKNSSEVLNRVAEKYDIIYVTHRDNAFIHKTKFWLDLFNYPAGPIFFWNFGKYTFNNEKYKQRIIKNLKKQFPNISVGIGDKTGDAIAYIKNGLKSILITDEKHHGLPEDVIQTKNWNKIEHLLLN